MNNNHNVVNDHAGNSRTREEISINIDSSDDMESECDLSERENRHLLPSPTSHRHYEQQQQQHRTPSGSLNTSILMEHDLAENRNAAVLGNGNNTNDIGIDVASGGGGGGGVSNGRNDRTTQSNLFTLFNNQLRRQRSIAGDTLWQQQQQPNSPQLGQPTTRRSISTDTGTGSGNTRNVRFWHMNLNDVLSYSTVPSPETIRSLFTHSNNNQYATLNPTNQTPRADLATATTTTTTQTSNNNQSNSRLSVASPNLRFNIRGTGPISRSISLIDADYAQLSAINSTGPIIINENNDGIVVNRSAELNRSRLQIPSSENNINSQNVSPLGINGDSENIGGGGNGAADATQQEQPNQNVLDDNDANAISDLFVKLISHLICYLPFICILFIKFIHDHLLGLFDFLILQLVMYHMNKSLRKQVSKQAQKSYIILIRDFSLILFVVSYRILLSTVTPDPFGLLISPPVSLLSMEVTPLTPQTHTAYEELSLTAVSQNSNDHMSQSSNNYQEPSISNNSKTPPGVDTFNIMTGLSLGMLLYYVAINDIVLKLLTILIKIAVTMLPVRFVRHKARGRLYVLIEYISQFYRALAPMRQWLIFLFESYSGLEVISGVLFSSFYLGAKGFEFMDRGKSLKKAIVNFVKNIDTERPPTKSELDAADALCPICHDSYNTPIILQCGHIFCEDCVGTWFRRENTCPMCRANVNEDPMWQDGSTTFFCQLF